MSIVMLMLLSSLLHGATLEDALRSALKKNETVKQAHEKVVQAEELLDQAKSGPRPTLSFNATHMIQDVPRNPLSREFSPEEQTTSNLNLKQPLFRGLREFAALRQRHDLLEAERANEEGSLARLYEDVATTYFEVLAHQQDLRNLDDQRELYADRVKNLQARARRGESARNEPLSAQSAEAVVEAEIAVIQTKLRTAREHLALLTGLSPTTELADDKSEDEHLTDVDSLEKYLARISERPDMVAARKNAEAAEETVTIAKRAHWPSLDLIGNYYFQRPGFMDEIDWDVQFKLTFPIYEGGLRVSETQQAASVHRERELGVARVRRTAEAEIKSLHENLSIRVRHLKALERATDLSRRNSQLLERDFRRGLARNIDVQAALAEYGVARRNYDQARYAARLDWVRLQRAAHRLPPAFSEYIKDDQ
ncbi:MAG: TolC family protein [Bdellovibrionales bacterium]